MKKILAYIGLAFVGVLVGSVAFAQEDRSPQEPVENISLFRRGEVVEIVSEERAQDFGREFVFQDIKVRLRDEEVGNLVVDVSFEAEVAGIGPLEVGDEVVVGSSIQVDGLTYYVSDVYRLNALWWILGLFMLLTILVARWSGVRAFIGLAVTFFVIFYFLVPRIVAGYDPVWLSAGCAVAIATVALYIAHGWRTRTHIAFVSTLATLLIAFGLGFLFVRLAQLTGIGSEDAFYLRFAGEAPIDIRGLLLGAIVIGVLGVLDDVTTAQTAAVEEIHKANNALDMHELYTRGLSVGREHITSLVNTLALAYTGASFPLLLLFFIYQQPVWVTLNSEIVLEEVIRMLVGSIALVCAVPITTVCAAWWYGKRNGTA